jgi:hypothetical protein
MKDGYGCGPSFFGLQPFKKDGLFFGFGRQEDEEKKRFYAD